jgi:hypothetical protein
MWQGLLQGYFDVTRWHSGSMLLGNLHHNVAAESFSQVIVLDEVQGKLVSTVVTVPATA